jgi:hypothetical protein
LVGGPDMARKKDHLENILNKKKYYSKNIKINNLGTYLAGLFEGLSSYVTIQKRSIKTKVKISTCTDLEI